MEGVDLRNRLKRAYYLVQCFRRILLVAAGLNFYKENMSGSQLVSVFIIDFFTLIYIGKAHAFTQNEINIQDLINETFLAFITFFTVAFTDLAQNEESKSFAAWVFIILILLMLVINMIPIIKESLKLFKMTVLRYSRMYCHNKFNKKNKLCQLFCFKINKFKTSRQKAQNQHLSLELLDQLKLKSFEKKAQFEIDSFKTLNQNYLADELQKLEDDKDKININKQTQSSKTKKQVKQLQKNDGIFENEQLQLAVDQLPRNICRKFKKVQENGDQIIQCEFLKAIGVNEQFQTWQEQYKRRKRVGQSQSQNFKKENFLKLKMKEIQEESGEEKSSQISELSIQSEQILQTQQKEINRDVDQEEYFQDKIVNQLDALNKGDFSIFTIYKTSNQSYLAEKNKQVLNILSINQDDQDLKKNFFDKSLDEMPTCIQDLMNHPTFTDPAYSRFRNYVKCNKTYIFDPIFLHYNWQQQFDIDEVGQAIFLEKFKVDYIFLLQNAIRNDDPAKVKLGKINALTYQLNNSCKRFIKQAKENEETQSMIPILEAQRNMAARDLYKHFLFYK